MPRSDWPAVLMKCRGFIRFSMSIRTPHLILPSQFGPRMNRDSPDLSPSPLPGREIMSTNWQEDKMPFWKASWGMCIVLFRPKVRKHSPWVASLQQVVKHHRPEGVGHGTQLPNAALDGQSLPSIYRSLGLVAWNRVFSSLGVSLQKSTKEGYMSGVERI